MASMEIKSLDRPDETRPFAAKGEAAVVNIGGAAVMRATFEPGWRWSEHVKPLAGTDSCQNHHVGYVLAGSLHVVTDAGEEFDVGPDGVYEILPGHDAWVIGDDVFQALEFQSKTAESYAKE